MKKLKRHRESEALENDHGRAPTAEDGSEQHTDGHQAAVLTSSEADLPRVKKKRHSAVSTGNLSVPMHSEPRTELERAESDESQGLQCEPPSHSNLPPNPPVNPDELQRAKSDSISAGVSQPSATQFFSSTQFSQLPLCDKLQKALDELDFKTMTEIQGRDIMGAAKTGSGKTLCFLVPALDMLYKVQFLPRNGTGVIIITPTRELALQIYDVTVNVAKYLPQTHGLVMGGINRKQEALKLSRGVNLLVSTPGRLLDHLQTTKNFIFNHLLMLIIDEADRILEIGFEEEMSAILKILPTKRQTLLFSATQTTKVADLARLSLRNPVFIQIKTEHATVEGLEQGYVLCSAADRFKLLFTFIKRNQDKKMMIFFNSCMSVKYHHELLNYIDIPNLCIHGKKKQTARMSTYYEFCQAQKGILLCTDVAARGLDIPQVHWIIQYDPPDDPKEYIHRVGRTARGFQGSGKALLFLMPEEVAFLHYLREKGIPIIEHKFNANKLANIQDQLEKIIEKNYYLHRSSRDAYRSYLHAYASHSLRLVFNVHKLDLLQVAKSFGFSTPPKVELNLRALSLKRANRVSGQRDSKKPKTSKVFEMQMTAASSYDEIMQLGQLDTLTPRQPPEAVLFCGQFNF